MSNKSLALILVKYREKPLTLDVARSICDEMFPRVEKQSVESLVLGDYVIAQERFLDVAHELEPLHKAHYTEWADKDAGLYKPMYQKIAAIDSGGGIEQFTVRHHGCVVGHMRFFVQTNHKTGELIAIEDGLFIVLEHRVGMLGLKLWRFAENVLRLRGVADVEFASPPGSRSAALSKRMKYRVKAVVYTKRLAT